MNHLCAPSTDLHLAVQELRFDIHQDQLDCNMELASLLHVHVWLAVSLILRLMFTMHVSSLLPILSLRVISPLFDIAIWLLPFSFSYHIRPSTCLPRSTCLMLIRVPRIFYRVDIVMCWTLSDSLVNLMGPHLSLHSIILLSIFGSMWDRPDVVQLYFPRVRLRFYWS
jgi:hypothetical protein